TGSVIATIPRAEYAVGDIVTFVGTSVNTTPTTHRIVGIESEAGETLFITKGDANEEEDYRRVGEDEILGKVFLSIPYAGYGVRALDSANGKAVLVTAIILLIAL